MRRASYESLAHEAARIFCERFGGSCRAAIAPGRVNLIGEHTDYNEGYVLPVAIDRHVAVAFAPNEGGLLRGYAADLDREDSARLVELAPTGSASWFDYVAGVAWVLRLQGLALRGMDFVVTGNVPIGAGLASSAALELAAARALCHAASFPWDATKSAFWAQRAENDYLGIRCGIMDQMAASVSRPGFAMLLDCRHLASEHIPIPEGVAIVILDTGTRRSLADSAYNERRDRCEEAVAAVKTRYPEVSALRDVSREMLDDCRRAMSALAYRRARHVIEENRRTLRMAEVLRAADFERVRGLMAGSHESLRELYDVSSPALDAMVLIAERHPACLGARMTGAGFAGCAVALVEASGADAFVHHVEASYRAASGEPGKAHRCRAEQGARIVGEDA